MTIGQWFVALARLAVGLCVALVLATPAHAQEAPITLSLNAGYEGAYRINEWFPVQIIAANTGPDVVGQLEWRFRSNPSQVFTQAIDLPQGSRKQVTMYVVGEDFSRNAVLSLTANNTELIQQDVQLEPLARDQLLVAVASSDPALLDSLSGATPTNFGRVQVRHIDLASLPERPHALTGVNILFVHDLDTTQLSEPQRIALEVWVQAGGQLVASGGNDGALVAAGLANLLPVKVAGDFAQQPLASLTQLVSDTDELLTETTVNTVVARPGAQALVSQAGEIPLLYQIQRGNGNVIFSTFDLAVLRGWRGEAELWLSTLDPQLHNSISGAAQAQQLNMLTDVLGSQNLVLLPVSVLFGLLILYILAIGPFNYLVLRRFRRPELAWATVPLVVIVFVTGIYLTGRVLRGNEARLIQITVVQSSEGDTRGLSTTYNGLFSPNRARYTMAFSAGTLVQEARSFDDIGGDARVIASDASTEVRDMLVNIGTTRTMLSESIAETTPEVQSSLSIIDGRVQGELVYNGLFALEDALIVRGRSFQQLGTLAPGTSSQANLDTANTNFPNGVSLDERASIDRERLLAQLSDLSEFSQSAFETNATYLVGWRLEPSNGVQLNGADVAAEGLMLYIIRLRDGQQFASPPV